MSALRVKTKIPVRRITARRTEHPYIVRVKGVCDGRPVIKGSRVSVRDIAVLYKRGETVDEILQTYPRLKPAAVYDAISYYHDHQADIEQEIRENRIEYLLGKYNAKLDARGRIVFRNKKRE